MRAWVEERLGPDPSVRVLGLVRALRGGDRPWMRLRQGRMQDDTVFSDNPVAVASRWVDEGARRLHLVDLVGAFGRQPRRRS